MSDFDQVRQNLNQARDAHSAAREQRSAARRRLQGLDSQIAYFERQTAEENSAARRQLVQLRLDRAKASDALQQAETKYTGARRSLDEFAGAFFAFSDPSRFEERLDDGIPLLM